MTDSESDEDGTAVLLALESRLTSSAERDYSAHVESVALLRGRGDLDLARAARERFAAAFPLSEAQWMAWIDDEERAGAATAALVERSLEDYLSVTLWQRHLTALAPQIEAAGDVGAVRARFEAAVSVAGQHFLDGAKLWRCLVALEDAVLSLCADVTAPAASAARGRVRDAYRRAIATPLLTGDGETFLQSYAEWEGAQPPEEEKKEEDGTSAAYDRVDAARALALSVDAHRTLCEAHEVALARAIEERDAARASGDAAALAPAEAALVAAWCAYADAAASDAPGSAVDGDVDAAAVVAAQQPQRVRCIYERAIAASPTNAALWERYVDSFAESAAESEAVLRRALRNCDSSATLWCAQLRALERDGRSDEECAALAQRALSLATMPSPLDYLCVVTERASQVCRRSPAEHDAARTAFSEGLAFIKRWFPAWAEGSSALCSCWATHEVKTLLSPDAARSVWRRAVESAGNIAALASVDGAWRSHELVWGDLASLDAAARCCATRRAALRVAAAAALPRAALPAAEVRAPSARAKRKMEAAATSDERGKKRARLSAGGDEVDTATGVAVFLKNLSYAVTDADVVAFFRTCGAGCVAVKLLRNRKTGRLRGLGYARMADAESAAAAVALSGTSFQERALDVTISEFDPWKPRDRDAPKAKASAVAIGPAIGPAASAAASAAVAPPPPLPPLSGRGDPLVHGSAPKRGLAIYVGRLPAEYDDAQLAALMAQCGAVVAARVVRDKATGKSKGHGFVEFAEKSAVAAAIALNGTRDERLRKKMQIKLSSFPGAARPVEQQSAAVAAVAKASEALAPAAAATMLRPRAVRRARLTAKSSKGASTAPRAAVLPAAQTNDELRRRLLGLL